MKSVLSEKMAVSATTVHDVMAKSSLEEAGCLLDDPREPRNSRKSCPLWRQLVGSNFVQTAGMLLFEDEIVATDSDNEKIGVPIRFSRRDEILDVIVHVDRTQPNRSEKSRLFRRKVGGITAFPVAVKSYCFIVNRAQARCPNIGFHDAIPSRSGSGFAVRLSHLFSPEGENANDVRDSGRNAQLIVGQHFGGGLEVHLRDSAEGVTAGEFDNLPGRFLD